MRVKITVFASWFLRSVSYSDLSDMVNIAIPVKIDHRIFVTMHFLYRENPLRVLTRPVDDTLYGPDVFSHLQIWGQVPYNSLCL